MFTGKKIAKEVKYWLEEFQQTVNKAAGNQYLQFTAEIWTTKKNSPIPTKEEIFQILTNNGFPFLDMEMSWSLERYLQLSVFRKRGHQLKYVSREITHTPGTLCAIPSELLNRLAKLTSQKPSLHNEGVYKIYPDHSNALRKAGLAHYNYPKMGDLWSKQDENVDMEKEPDVNKKENRNVYFCVGYSRYFYTSIHRVINRLKKCFNLSWIRIKMSYHRFNNLVELLNGHLGAKIGRGSFTKTEQIDNATVIFHISNSTKLLNLW